MEGARRRGRRSELGPGGTGGGADLISALPEDLLLQIIVRLRCTRAAARTSLLCRRWRGLWVYLPDLIFRNVPLVSLLAALSSLQAAAGPSPGLSLLDIRVPGNGLDVACVPSLLHAAAGLSPVDFSLVLPRELIQLYQRRLTPPRPSGGFSALERLSLSISSCCLDLAALVRNCPCLRVLWVADGFLDAGINIRSESLQELYVRSNYRSTDRIGIETPLLKKLTLLFSTGTELSVSVVAPIVEKVSWECSYSMMTPAGRGPWCLDKVSLAKSFRQRVITGPGENVLSLQMSAYHWFDSDINIVQQIEKHLVTDFSVLELTMAYDYDTGHVFGPSVLHLLGTHQIRTATRRLQIQLLRSKAKEECSVNCPCDEPKNWRSKYISLINLEEVEIKGFEGGDDEFDFLKLIFRCAPILTKLAVKALYEFTTSNDQCVKIYDIFKAYPSVECKLMQQ